MKTRPSLVSIGAMTPSVLFHNRFPGIRAALIMMLAMMGHPALARDLPTVGGGSVSLSGGAPTVVTVITKDRENQAKRIGSYISDEEFANGQVLTATVLNFDGKLQPSMRKITEAQIELDLKKESARLGPVYRRLGVDHSPMNNLHVVPDYDGSIARSLGVDSEKNPIVVLIYDQAGNLKARFSGLPGRKQFREYLDPLL